MIPKNQDPITSYEATPEDDITDEEWAEARNSMSMFDDPELIEENA